jgi:hypothetical protein
MDVKFRDISNNTKRCACYTSSAYKDTGSQCQNVTTPLMFIPHCPTDKSVNNDLTTHGSGKNDISYHCQCRGSSYVLSDDKQTCHNKIIPFMKLSSCVSVKPKYNENENENENENSNGKNIIIYLFVLLLLFLFSGVAVINITR